MGTETADQVWANGQEANSSHGHHSVRFHKVWIHIRYKGNIPNTENVINSIQKVGISSTQKGEKNIKKDVQNRPLPVCVALPRYSDSHVIGPAGQQRRVAERGGGRQPMGPDAANTPHGHAQEVLRAGRPEVEPANQEELPARHRHVPVLAE